MLETLEKYLLEAAGKPRQDINQDNPYRDIGFDNGKERLGWVKPLDFIEIEKSLERASGILKGKNTFIFVGMGGSINGIKPLFSIFNKDNYYTLDNLDPAAVSYLSEKVSNFDKTLVIPISKSGTTAETQLLASALRKLFAAKLGENNWQKHFLWLSDSTSFNKLDSLGWAGVTKEFIQPDSRIDIGGRFSSPHTLIFLLPLFLLQGSDKDKLKKTYESFSALAGRIREKAYLVCDKCKDKPDAYFHPILPSTLSESFSSWIVQLFQESLGSKLDNFPVKTITGDTGDKLFFSLRLDIDVSDKAVSLTAQMYFFQVFIAYYSAAKNLNFVSQNFVEKYKEQMRQLESGNNPLFEIENLPLAAIIDKAKAEAGAEHSFIEIVLYFYPGDDSLKIINDAFSRAFPSRKILMFVGSDWNHQSYQAAFSDKSTFYVLILSSCYNKEVKGLDSEVISKNIKTLENIAKATYLTLEDKSILVAYRR